MNSRTVVIGVVVLGILGVGGYLWYTNENPAPVFYPTGATTTPPQGAVSTSATLHTVEHGTYYDIDASSPASVAVPGGANALALMKGFEQDTIAQFKRDGNFANLTPKDIQIQGLGPDRKYSLQITYDTRRSAHTISYVYTVYTDTLGAHPNASYRTFTFNTATGANLNLSDLFTSGANYLGTLSTKARAGLPALIAKREGIKPADVDRTMLNSGTEPTVSNFSSWYLDGGNLVIVFPPYQVAAYAAGEQELSLPLSSLSGVQSSYK